MKRKHNHPGEAPVWKRSNNGGNHPGGVCPYADCPPDFDTCQHCLLNNGKYCPLEKCPGSIDNPGGFDTCDFCFLQHGNKCPVAGEDHPVNGCPVDYPPDYCPGDNHPGDNHPGDNHPGDNQRGDNQRETSDDYSAQAGFDASAWKAAGRDVEARKNDELQQAIGFCLARLHWVDLEALDFCDDRLPLAEVEKRREEIKQTVKIWDNWRVFLRDY